MIGEAEARRKAEWRAKNPERVREYSREWMRAWRKANREKERANANARRAKNPAKARARYDRWRRANPERVRQLRRDWARTHPGSRRAWRHANPEKVLESNRKRGIYPTLRWLLRKRPDLTERCAIGGGAAHHADHILPVALGGTNALDNLRPLCARHNLARGAAIRTDEELRVIPCGPAGRDGR